MRLGDTSLPDAIGRESCGGYLHSNDVTFCRIITFALGLDSARRVFNFSEYLV